DAEPGEVLDDAVGEFLRRAREIGVVEAQDEAPSLAPRQEIVEQRRTRVADMQAAGGRRGEADDGSGHQRDLVGLPRRLGRTAGQVAYIKHWTSPSSCPRSSRASAP